MVDVCLREYGSVWILWDSLSLVCVVMYERRVCTVVGNKTVPWFLQCVWRIAHRWRRIDWHQNGVFINFTFQTEIVWRVRIQLHTEKKNHFKPICFYIFCGTQKEKFSRMFMLLFSIHWNKAEIKIKYKIKTNLKNLKLEMLLWQQTEIK